ncbi:HLH transcription factor [Pyrenophora seminiperda CCB06]|uniref:HLH transcription factor n=1 Tax=Pyrenophora seminiperda CCB06 TaxID=1302712 RepID=A0A3M7M3X1_9PLEO|nr:HLH transcription factor [Pyrenophora seminiperda CCB06]
MPRPNLPPTPQPSTDITGKHSINAPQLESGFILPPAALGGRGSVASSSGRSENASDSSYRPLSPSSPVATSKPGHARKRSSIITKDDYSLPPPPTRSRKIIQMKPKDTEDASKTSTQPQNAKATTATTSGTKRKQSSNTTAAGRKIARKTAHSLIERRRRSKMNEEFGVLKDMIPACRGQEMHKLAILQVCGFVS